jgi:DNA modification methylase
VAAVAQRYGRHFVHLDLSKKYCAVAVERVAAEMKQMRLDEIPSRKPKNTPAHALVTA